MNSIRNILSELDYDRLSLVIDNTPIKRNIHHLLEQKIDEMDIVDSKSISNNLITMNSEII